MNPPPLQIVQTDDLGKALATTQSHVEGTEIFREEALIVFDIDPSATKEDLTPPPWIDKPGSASRQRWMEYCAYQRQSDQRQQEILSLYAGETTNRTNGNISICRDHDAVRMRTFLQEKLVGDLDIEEFIRLAMVIKFNAVGIPPDNYGLFRWGCRMAHSCHPNCVWFSSQHNEKVKIVRSIKPLQEAQILTIDYYGKTFEPIWERQEFFLLSKNFACSCQRCASTQGDDTRRFPCQQHPTCHGVHFCHQPRHSSVPMLLACSNCGHSPSENYQKQMLQAEEKCRRAIDAFDKDAVTKHQIIDVELPHHFHGIAMRVFSAQVGLFEGQGDWKSAAVAQENKLRCFHSIMGDDFKDEDLANDFETMGDLCSYFDLEKAREAYREAVKCHHLTRGEHTYTKGARRKLLEVSRQLETVSFAKRSQAGHSQPA